MSKTALCGRNVLVMTSSVASSDRSNPDGFRFTAQMLRIMRILSFLLFITCLSAAVSGASQSVTLYGEKLTIKEVFFEIKKQTGYSVAYAPELFPENKMFSFRVKDFPLLKFLDIVIRDHALKHKIEEKTIFISRKLPVASFSPPLADNLPSPPLTGRIRSQDGLPLAGITFSKNNSVLGLSDDRGRFSLIVSEDDIISVSAVGYLGLKFRVTTASQAVSSGRPESTLFRAIFLSSEQPDTVQEDVKDAASKKSSKIRKPNISALTGVDVISTGFQSIPKEKGTGSFIQNTDIGLLITLVPNISALKGIEVSVNTGYQKVPKERATGSFELVDSSLLQRRMGSNILDRLENMIPGVVFDRSPGAPDPILIRGRSTIFGDASPLIVLDNFPYEGDIKNINPNDIESVTVLKDAAAASIWGSRAGNGVIVITTKKGKATKPNIDFNTNVTIQPRPDIYNVPQMLSKDFIEIEESMFERQFYDGKLTNNFSWPVLSPVVLLLDMVRANKVDEITAREQIDKWKEIDFRDDLYRYFNQTAFHQQHTVNISGRSEKVNYYLSAGLDKNKENLVGNSTNRFTLRGQYGFKLYKGLEFNTSLQIGQQRIISSNPGTRINGGGLMGMYPYADLVDDFGNALPLSHVFSEILKDSISALSGVDWSNRPYADLGQSSYTTSINNSLLQTSLTYQPYGWLRAELHYQFQQENNDRDFLNKKNSYYTRNLVNSFFQPTATNKFPVPYGGILEQVLSKSNAHQGRFQVVVDKTFGLHGFHGIAGWEIRNVLTKGRTSTFYGYERDGNIVKSDMNFGQAYKNSYNTSTNMIPNGHRISETLDRFLSTYGNFSYTYDSRYTFSGSIRNDAANLYGIETNMKGIPLWSAGMAWQLNKESFYKLDFLPQLRLKATYGHNGNLARGANAQVTARYRQYGIIPELSADILALPNERLRWEKVKQLNLGVDFALKMLALSGTIEYYKKSAVDLLGRVGLDPTLGPSTFFGNVANMKGSGWDISLHARIGKGKFLWKPTFIGSYVQTTITKYLMPVGNGNAYLTENRVNPVSGKPVFAVFGFRWEGLDDQGDPLSWLNGHVSKDYNNINSKTPLDSMVFAGSIQPLFFAGFRQAFQYGPLSLSFSLSYKGGHYFRATSIDYGTGTFVDWWMAGHPDYSKRWQKAGDESITTVPSYRPDLPIGRQAIYKNSSVLIEKADMIRLDDVQVSYNMAQSTFCKAFFSNLIFHCYVRPRGLIWAANGRGIDPQYKNISLPATSITLGVTAQLK